jgi:hypothetical protein
MRVVIFNDKSEEVIENVFRKVFASKLKQNLHGIKVPLMSGGKSFCQFSDLDDKVVAEVVVRGTMEGVEHFGDDDLHVILSGHPEEKLQGLSL